MIVVKVRDRDIKAAPMGPVTSGGVGLPVSWHFSEEWDDLAKTAVFRVGNDGTEITVAVLEDLCLVPDELLVQANAGENLWIGVYGWKGTNANDTIVPEIAMPTIWTYTRIQDGSQPSGIEPPEGTPGWSAQIQNATDEALRVAHGVAADAAEGDFDGISPAVTISSITHGHSVTITDRDHPTGQSFPVLDGDSAYEQAVAGGYTGTEAQFNEELASFKELSDEMKEVAPFYAEYGVTTKAEIDAAINNKRQIYLNRGGGLGGVVAPYTGTFLYADIWGEGTGYRFARTNGNWQYVYELKSEWTYSIYDLTAPAQRAEEAAGAAEGHASAAAGSAGDASRDAGTASEAATAATTKAGEASNSATAADGSAKDAEAYAVGKRGGTDVGSTDPAYHNNAKYYAQQASGSASDAATAKGAAETAQGLAESAQTAAETAQGKAEDAQEAAEAVLASIPEDYTALTEDVDDLKSAVGSNAFALDEHILQPIKYATLSSDLAVTFSSPESQLDTDYVSGLIPLPETLDGKIKHNGNGYASSRAIVFYNSAKAPIDSATQKGYDLIETTIPDGSAFFRLRRGGGSASQVLQASFNLSAAEKANYLRTLIHFESDLYIYDFDAPDMFTMEHTEISTSTGEDTYSSASGYSATDFILLPDDIELIGTYAYTGAGRARVAFYDADKVFISAVYSNSKRLAATSIPEGAVFVRFGTHSTIPPASCIAVGLVKMSKSNDEIIDMIRQSLV